MSDDAIRISIIVPTYCPGDGIERVIASLDAQTLPTDQFEVILIDDGSPDDTITRLRSYAATRPHVRVEQIENSGWPSRPRNVATRLARGEYVLYMDHDDSLYPEALARIIAFADQTGADLISPKESKTSEVWWAMHALAAGNAADVKAGDEIGRILPMVPHKVYRREFLLANDITFPEGRRQLWEDIYVNVEAYAKAERGVGVLADTPIYLWWESQANNSGTYGASDAEFWDRLDELMAFIDATLSGPALAIPRRTMIIHQYQGRVLRRLGRQLQNASAQEVQTAFARARAIQDAYVPVEWDARLGFFSQLRARFLRANQPEALLALHRATEGLSMKTTASRVEWIEDRLEVEAVSRWRRATAHTVAFARSGDRVRLRFPAPLDAMLPPEALDVTERIERFVPTFGLRARAEYVTWQLPQRTTSAFATVSADEVTPSAHTVATVDLATAAMGAPLDRTVWDFTTMSRWEALSKGSAVFTDTRPLAALHDGVAAVAYANQSGKLSLDLAQRLQNVVAAAGITAVDTSGPVLHLGPTAVHGRTSIPLTLQLTSDRGTEAGLAGRLIGDQTGARVELDAPLPHGRFALGVTVGERTTSARQRLRVRGRHAVAEVSTGSRSLRQLGGALLRRLGLR